MRSPPPPTSRLSGVSWFFLTVYLDFLVAVGLAVVFANVLGLVLVVLPVAWQHAQQSKEWRG